MRGGLARPALSRQALCGQHHAAGFRASTPAVGLCPASLPRSSRVPTSQRGRRLAAPAKDDDPRSPRPHGPPTSRRLGPTTGRGDYLKTCGGQNKVAPSRTKPPRSGSLSGGHREPGARFVREPKINRAPRRRIGGGVPGGDVRRVELALCVAQSRRQDPHRILLRIGVCQLLKNLGIRPPNIWVRHSPREACVSQGTWRMGMQQQSGPRLARTHVSRQVSEPRMRQTQATRFDA